MKKKKGGKRKEKSVIFPFLHPHIIAPTRNQSDCTNI